MAAISERDKNRVKWKKELKLGGIKPSTFGCGS